MRRVLAHDCLNLAQSTAYSAIVSLFPALIVAAAIVGFSPDTAPIRTQVGLVFDRILPPDVSPLLEGYFVDAPDASPRSAQALLIALIVSLSGASSVIATMMEGVRRANDLPADCWTFWQRRRRALLLIPLSLIPLVCSSSLVVFGHMFTFWLALHISPIVRTSVYIFALFVRWFLAFGSSIGIIALIYHMGTPMRQSWKRVVPGAIVSTAMWFFSTIIFGLYVTRFANYSKVYGSLGAGIALLFWLFIISLSVLSGAEFNTEFHHHFLRHHLEDEPSPSPSSPSRV